MKVLNSSIVVLRRVAMQYWTGVSDGELEDVDAVTAGISGDGRYIIDFLVKIVFAKFLDGQPSPWKPF